MNFFLQWIAPPLVGAIIGYVTNAIAIKMLFRPLTEKRIAGIRVPFTPGILPQQRAKLAVNIGKMVSRELLTESIVRERLRTAEFRALIEKAVSSYTDKIFSSTVSEAATVASNLPMVRSEGSLSDLGRSVGAIVDRFVVSESFATLVRSVGRHAVEQLGSKSLSELLGSSVPVNLSTLLERLFASLASPETEKRVAEAIERYLEAKTSEGAPIGESLPDATADTVSKLADLLYPVASEALLRFLNERETRRELEAKGQIVLRDAMQELNSFQRFFVSAGQYDRTLSERMPAIVDGLIDRIAETIRQDATRMRFGEAVLRSVEDFLSKSADKALASLKTDPSSVSRLIASRLASLLGSSGGGSRLRGLAEDFLGKLEKEPIERILRDRLGLDPLALADMASFSLVAYIRAESPSAIPRLVDGFLAEHRADKLSVLLGIDAGEKAKWDALLSEKIVDLIDERISAVIESLDVQKMVADRIDSLEMEQVERIVLDVLAGQLKWIDIFGAVLGALMGLFQCFLALALK